MIGFFFPGFKRIFYLVYKILRNRLIAFESVRNRLIDRAKLTGENSVAPAVKNNSIYIKEADDSLKYLIQTTLELQGYDIQDEIDAQSGIQPSVIIMDSGSSLNELKLLKEMKSSQNYVNTKFIVTTTTHDKSAVLDAGADVYLPKPYEISDLIRWVEYFIKQ